MKRILYGEITDNGCEYEDHCMFIGKYPEKEHEIYDVFSEFVGVDVKVTIETKEL